MVYIKSNKTKLLKNEKRRLLLETAAKLFADNGYHQTSVKNITDAAKISVGTFYLYFKNKEDLFEKLYDEVEFMVERIKNYAFEMKTDSPAERFANVLTSSLWIYQRFKELARILLIEAVGLNPRIEQKYSQMMFRSNKSLEETLNQLKDLGIIDVPDTKIAAIAIDGAFNNLITYWLRIDDQTDLRSYAYPLAACDLQTLRIDYQQEAIERSIKHMFLELDKLEPEVSKFTRMGESI
jgi:AcrR family transcriptional regulator